MKKHDDEVIRLFEAVIRKYSQCGRLALLGVSNMEHRNQTRRGLASFYIHDVETAVKSVCDPLDYSMFCDLALANATRTKSMVSRMDYLRIAAKVGPVLRSRNLAPHEYFVTIRQRREAA